MTSKETYNYLGGWFAEGMRKAYAESYGKKATKHKELQGYGQFGDFKPWVQNMLWELFDKVALRGKEHYLLADGSGRCVYAYNGKHYERMVIATTILRHCALDGYSGRLNEGTFQSLALPTATVRE